MAIAATVLRASPEKAARSVSHCQVSAERGKPQRSAAADRRVIKEVETAICWGAFTAMCSAVRRIQGEYTGSFSHMGPFLSLLKGLWIKFAHWKLR